MAVLHKNCRRFENKKRKKGHFRQKGLTYLKISDIIFLIIRQSRCKPVTQSYRDPRGQPVAIDFPTAESDSNFYFSRR
jgi:hypothetical protein